MHELAHLIQVTDQSIHPSIDYDGTRARPHFACCRDTRFLAAIARASSMVKFMQHYPALMHACPPDRDFHIKSVRRPSVLCHGNTETLQERNAWIYACLRPAGRPPANSLATFLIICRKDDSRNELALASAVSYRNAVGRNMLVIPCNHCLGTRTVAGRLHPLQELRK